MQVMCPNCNRQAEIAGAGPGEVVSCPHCGKAMRLPEAEAQSAPPSPAPPSPSPAPAGAGADGVVSPQRFAGGMISPAAMRCPHCGEEVAEGAPRCPHCDTWFDEAARREDRREGPDWEQLSAQGLWTRLWGTTRAVLLEPEATFRRMKLTGFGPAVTYGLTCGVISGVFSAVYQGVWMLIQLGFMGVGGGAGGQQFTVFLVMGIAQVVAALVLVPLFQIVGMFISAAFTQLGLVILKCANKPYEVTFRVVGYAQGAASLLNIVPVCGGLIAWIWGLVATIIGVAKVQEISYGRATAAVLLVPLALALLIGLVVVAIVVIAIAAGA